MTLEQQLRGGGYLGSGEAEGGSLLREESSRGRRPWHPVAAEGRLAVRGLGSGEDLLLS